MWRILKIGSEWSVEGTQISGDDVKDLVKHKGREGWEETSVVPRVFVMSHGATGAVRSPDGADCFLYWE
jgi:hypothetical protein